MDMYERYILIIEQRIINYLEWLQIKENAVINMTKMTVMEPYEYIIITIFRYGIFKRTLNTPLFNPFFINYGGNKEEFYNVLNTMGMLMFSLAYRLSF